MALRAGGWVACALALTLATTSADANEAQVVAEKCGSDEDCSLNGVCQPATAICACDPAWGGPACATLNLLPVPGDPAATVAVAYPPPADFNTTTSWGGSVVKAEDGQYHLFAAEMAVCKTTFLTPSRVVSALMPSHGRRMMCYTWCKCLLDADRCHAIRC